MKKNEDDQTVVTKLRLRFIKQQFLNEHISRMDALKKVAFGIHDDFISEADYVFRTELNQIQTIEKMNEFMLRYRRISLQEWCDSL